MKIRKSNEWWSKDVAWTVDGKKRPIAYSTVSTSDFIEMMNEPNRTPNELLNRIKNETTGDFEAEAVLEQYIALGYGDTVLITRL